MNESPPNTLQEPTTAVAVKPKNKYTYRPSKKNNLFMEYWTDPKSQTFGNVYQSGVRAGFSPTYSKNMLNVAPKWLLTYIDRTEFTKDHIANLLQTLAISSPNSRSPDDTRLKAIELMMKAKGMLDNKATVQVNVVQPILNGNSVIKPQTTSKHSSSTTHEVIDLIPE